MPESNPSETFILSAESLHDLRNGIQAIRLGLNLLESCREDAIEFTETLEEVRSALDEATLILRKT